MRSKVYLYFLANYWHSLSGDQRKMYAAWAYDDAHWFNVVYGRSRESALIYGQALIYAKHTHDEPDGYRFALKQIQWILDDETITEPITEHELAFAYNLRAQCHHFLGEMEKVEEGYNESIEAEPSDPRWYLNRAQYWDQRGRSDLANADRQVAQSLREDRAALASGRFPASLRRPTAPALPSATESPFEVPR